jgi:chemotaxis protein CheD
MIPTQALALGAVVASSVVITFFDPVARKGGLCHYLMPRPSEHERATPKFGLPAILAMLRVFTAAGASVESLVVGVYGGACPGWASLQERGLADGNVEIAREVLKKKNVKIHDEDIGGERGRKLWYLSDSNEIAVVKTDAVRRSDWFPEMGD